MTDPNSLSLPEELMLLALHDEDGTIKMGTFYLYAIGGAVLAELLMRDRLRLDSSKKKTVHLVNAKSLGDPLLDDCLTRVRDSKKQLAAQTWVTKFAGLKDLKHRLAARLCDRGILKADEDKILLLFNRRIYPEINPKPEKEMIERLRQAIFSEADHLDPRTVVLVSLAHSAGLLPMAFDKKDLKARKARIERILEGDALAAATQEAIEAVQAALFVAVIMPAITTSVITTTTS